MRRTLSDIRENVQSLTSVQTAPRPVQGFQGQAQAFQNYIQWIKSNADFYEVYIGVNPNFEQSNLAYSGTLNKYTDNVGQSNVTKYYWVRPVNSTAAGHPGGNIAGPQSGPIKLTTLASNTGVTPLTPPVAGDQMVIDQTTGAIIQNPNQ
jgi:hypothetical protein